MVKFLGINKDGGKGKGGKKEYKTIPEAKYDVFVSKVIPYTGKPPYRNGLDIWFKIIGGDFANQIIFFRDWVKYEKNWKDYEEGTGYEPSFEVNEGSLLEKFYSVCKDALGGKYPESSKQLKEITLNVEVKHNKGEGEKVYVNIFDFIKATKNRVEDKKEDGKKSDEKKDDKKDKIDDSW